MAISGHKTRSVFDRYNIVAERDQRGSLPITNLPYQCHPARRETSGEALRMVQSTTIAWASLVSGTSSFSLLCCC